jgi:hypothetical protein
MILTEVIAFALGLFLLGLYLWGSEINRITKLVIFVSVALGAGLGVLVVRLTQLSKSRSVLA